MIIEFTPEQQKKIKLSFNDEKKHTARYLREREKCWQEALIDAEANGVKLWNGTVYTIEEIENLEGKSPRMVLGKCQYKDLVFKRYFDRENVAIEFPGQDSKQISTGCVPVTIDQKLVLGIRGKQILDGGKMGLVGGTVNFEEILIKKFDDFSQNIELETNEELNLIADQIKSTSLLYIDYYEEEYLFMYRVNLRINSNDLLTQFEPGEFSKLIVVSLNELDGIVQVEQTALSRFMTTIQQKKYLMSDLL